MAMGAPRIYRSADNGPWGTTVCRRRWFGVGRAPQALPTLEIARRAITCYVPKDIGGRGGMWWLVALTGFVTGDPGSLRLVERIDPITDTKSVYAVVGNSEQHVALGCDDQHARS